ncbi:hypothetical protein MTR_3g111390 [Medicago truncatula]|uniref:RNase H type-1 domain-containing protein n=1 Tax=Medicago truncatula TaxID=3880 RepID=G7J4L8_MEDTR|nr:hypothetical protein MTR_1g070820 [Medicago truncatula]AES73959.1 hypothetical protein MTR_3g111390 [Medicago truncatula]
MCRKPVKLFLNVRVSCYKDGRKHICVKLGWGRANNTVSADRSSSSVLGEGEQQPAMRAVSTISAGGSNSTQQQHIRWQKPGTGRLKCNVDVEFTRSLNVIGVDMFIRDEAGQFVAAKTLRSGPICESGIGEALGLSYAIQWVHELKLTNVDFEMDAKRVVDYYNKVSNDISEFSATIDDCRRRCCYWFENSKTKRAA